MKLELYVKLDSRNRITIPQKMAKELAHLYKIYKKNETIILEPVQEIPDEEKWLFAPENKELLKKVKKGLKQKATIKRGSFGKYLK